MKKIILISCSVFFVAVGQANGIAGWPPDNVEIVPENPTSADVVHITFSGEWPDSCIPNGSAISVDGNDIYFDVVHEYPPDWLCFPVVLGWLETQFVGPLSPGTYTVYVGLTESFVLPPYAYIYMAEFNVECVTYHVDGVNGNDANDGLSRETAFATIQKGIDTADDCDMVLVWPGVYVESVYFIDKAITVKSAADAAILEAAGYNAVSFYTSEGQDTVLANFVIRDSNTGILVSTGTPTISNITLVGNNLGIEAENGAVPDIRNCIFWNNTNGDLWNCTAQYSCIEETGVGEGNISSDPLFADANNDDYHLLSERGRYRASTDEWILDEVSSPCIDGGEPNVWPLEEQMPNGGRINMGAYGNTASASMSEWGLEADFDYDGIVANGDVGILSDDWLEELTFSDDAEFTLSYEITDLGTLDNYGRVWAINDNGQVAGGYGGNMYAFVWDPVNGKIDLGFLVGGGKSRANHINNAGYAVGKAWAGDDNHAFIWDDVNGMVDLGTLYFNDLYFSEAFCINDAGQVVGESMTEQGRRAFLWDSTNGMVNLGTLGDNSRALGINNNGQVVGDYATEIYYIDHAFLWDSTNGMVDIGTLGGDESTATAINDSGQVVGHSSVTGLSPNHAFIWDDVNGMEDLGTFGGDHSVAMAINNAGQVVGNADTNVSSENHAFLWDSTNGMIDLSELALEDAGFTQITYATGINNRGQIVGYGEISGEVHAFVMTPATTWHVDGAGGSNNNDGLTRETAFATIQKGVSSAEDCDTVVVWPGIYDGPVYIVDKAIVVKSADEAAVIDGGFDDAVVFYSWEGKEAVLKNFVIKNGFAGVYVYNGGPELANLTIVDCYTGIEAETGAEPNIVSTIVWDNDYDLWNCTAQYSCIEETGAGEGNISSDPLFADANNGDYHLLSERGRYRATTDEWLLDDVSSPAIDGGDPYASPSGELWPNGGRVNMGAYGGTTQASRSEWPFAGDLNLDGVVNLADFALLADEWVETLPWAAPPEISITNPSEGEHLGYNNINPISVEAEASGTVVKVEFFANGSKIGQDYNGLDGWDIGWYPESEDGVALTATATTQAGVKATSTAVNVTVEYVY